jgi:hypothetical protein
MLVEVPVSSLGCLFRFPKFKRTCLARHTVPRGVVVFVTGLNGRGSGWCFPSTSGSGTKGGRSTGVTGPEDNGELEMLFGSLGESSGRVTRFSEACSAAGMSYGGLRCSIIRKTYGLARKEQKLAMWGVACIMKESTDGEREREE